MDTANGLNIASRIKIKWLSRLSLRKAHSDKGTIRENSCNAFFNLSSGKKTQHITPVSKIQDDEKSRICPLTQELELLLNKALS